MSDTFSNFIDGEISGPLLNTINAIKKKNPEDKFKENKEVYRKYYNLIPSDQKVPRLDKFYALGENTRAQSKKGKTTLSEQEKSINRNPSVMAKMIDAFGESISDDTFFSDAFQAGYQKSIAGRLREAEYGAPKFDLQKMYEDGDISTVEDLSSNLFAILNPLDAGLLFTGGAYGQRLYTQRVNNFVRKAQKKAGDKAGKGVNAKRDYYRKNAPILEQMKDGFVRGAMPMSVYEGALGYAQAQIDGTDPFLGAAKGASYGFILGGTATGVGAGLVGSRAAALGKSSFSAKEIRNMSLGNKAIWAGTSVPMKIVAESGIYAGAQTMNQVFYHGKDFRWEDLRNNWAMGASMFTVLKGKESFVKYGQEAVRKMRNYYKGKVRSKETQAMERVQKQFEDKTLDQDKLAPWNDAMHKLGKTKTESSDKISQVGDDLKSLVSDFDKATALLKSGKAEDGMKLVTYLKDIEARLDGVTRELDHIPYEKGGIDAANYSEVKEALGNFKIDYDGFIKNEIDDSFESFINSRPNVGKLASQLHSLGINDVFVGSKLVPIVDPNTGAVQVDYDVLKNKLDEVQGQDVSPLSINVVSKDQFLAQAKQQYVAVGSKGEGMYERQTDLAEYLGDYLSPKSLVGSKHPILTGSALKSYNTSKAWIENMIQTYYPTKFPQGGASKNLVAVKTLAKEIDILNKFATYLANKADGAKNFSTMTKTDVSIYLAQNPSHKGALRNLQEKMRTIAGSTNDKVMDESLKELSPADVSALANLDVPTRKQLSVRKGLRVKNIDTDKGYVLRTPSKTGQPNFVPISNELNNSLKVLIEENKKLGISVEDGDTPIFNTVILVKDKNGNIVDHEIGIPLRKRDVNAIVEFFLGSKITPPTPKSKGGAKTTARALRKVLGEFAVIYDAKNGTGLYSIVDAMGLGHGAGTTSAEALKGIYGAGESELITNYKTITDALHQALKKPPKGSGKTDKYRYTILEVHRALKEITGMKDGETRTLEITGNKTEGSQIQRTYSKATIESLFRMLIENPSRLNEIVLDDISNTKLKDEMNEMLYKNNQDFDEVFLNKNNNNENDGKGPSASISDAQNTLFTIEKAMENIKEWKKKDPHRKEKLDENRSIRVLESQIFSAEAQEAVEKAWIDAHMKSERNDLRRTFFGTSKYEVNPNYTLETFKAYKTTLQTIKNEKDVPSDMDLVVAKALIPKAIAKELAVALGSKSGDPNKLSPVGREIFKDFLKEYSPQTDFSDITDVLINDGSAGYLHLLQTGTTGLGSLSAGLAEKIGMKRFAISAWVLAKNMEKKSTGMMKKYASDLYQFTSDFDYHYTHLHGLGNTFKNKILTHINKNDNAYGLTRNPSTKDMRWMDKDRMEEIIIQKDNPKIDKELRELYQKAYDRNIRNYEATKKLGTWQNEAVVMLDDFFGGRFGEFLAVHKNAHEPIKGSSLYDDKIAYAEGLRVDNYRPRMATDKLFTLGKRTEYFEKKLKKEVEKKIPGKIHDSLKGKSVFKHLKGAKIKLKMADKDYLDAYNAELETWKEGGDKWNNLEDKLSSKLHDFMIHGEGTVNSSNFMSRGEKFPEFVKVPVRSAVTGRTTYKYIESMETNLGKILTNYNDASSKVITTLRTAPEYMNADLYYNKGVGPTKKSLDMIQKYEANKLNESITADYLRDIIEGKMIGVNAPKRAYAIVKTLGNLTNLGGLSGLITHGIKNLGIGVANSLTTRPSKFYRRAFFNWFNSHKRGEMLQNAKELGAIGFTKQEFEGIKRLNNLQSYVYKWSGMEPAEDFVRTTDIEATKLMFSFLVEDLNAGHLSLREIEMVTDWCSDVARLTPKDIELITSGKVLEESDEGSIAFNHIMNKAGHYAHKSTQGGLSPMDNPSWMSNPNFRYMLTFMKIVRSVSDFGYYGILKPAIKHQNFKPLVKWLIGFGAVGAGLELLNELLFSKDSPRSLGTKTQKVMNWYITGGAFMMAEGVLKQIPQFNPHHQDKGVWENLIGEAPPFVDMTKSIIQTIGGDKTWPELAREKITLVNQLDTWNRKFIKANGKDFDLIQDTHNMKKQFKQHLEETTGVPYENPSEMTKEFREFKHDLYFSTVPQLAEAYYELVNKKIKELMELKKTEITEPDMQIIVDQAHKAIESSIKGASPVPFSDNDKGLKSSLREGFYAFVLERGGIKEQNKAKKALNLFDSKVDDIKYIRKSKKYRDEYQDYLKGYSYSPDSKK